MERANPDVGRWLKRVAQRSGLRSFWRWWLAELVPLTPARVRTALARRRLLPIVAIERDAAVLWAPVVSNGALAFNDVARIPLQGDAADLAREGQAALEALPRINGGAEKRVVIALPTSQVLRKSVRLHIKPPAQLVASPDSALLAMTTGGDAYVWRVDKLLG